MARLVAVLAPVVLGAGVGLACPCQPHGYSTPPVAHVPGLPPVVFDSARAQEPGQAPVPKEPEPKPTVNRTPTDPGAVIDPLPLPKDFDAAAIYEKCVRSTVFIVTPLKGGMAMGSGTLIDAERRYVLTNYHVVDEVDQVFVQFPVQTNDGTLMTDKKKYIERIHAGQALKGKVVFRDDTRDLALIQLDKLPPGTQALPLAKKSVRPAEPVINIGNPAAVDWVFSTTQGNVRGIGVADFVVGRGSGGDVLRVKARVVTVTNPINPGDSGGPLIDKRGYLVAVTESGRVGAQNVNNCIDVTEVWGLLNQKKITIKDLTDDKDDPRRPRRPEPRPPHDPDNPDRRPPGVEPPSKPGPSTPPAVRGPTPDEERAAATLLQRAKLFKDDDDQEYYKAKLNAIVTKYPETAAGKDAKKLLGALK